MARIEIRGREFHRVSRSISRTDTKSSFCLRKVRIILDKSIVHKYLNAKRKLMNSSVDNVKKQIKVTDYFRNNEIFDCTTLNRNEAVIKEEINTQTIGSCNNIFHDIDSQASISTKNNEDSSYTIKTEPRDIGNEIVIDEYCYNEVDVGEEFKYSVFLSESTIPKVNVLNEQTIKVTHDKEDSKYIPKRSDKRKKQFHCDNCDFKAREKSLLVNHIRIRHSKFHDENGFITCIKCSTKFITLNRYKAHERTCGTYLYLSCKFCRTKVRTPNRLKKHVINHHPEEFGNKVELNDIVQCCKLRKVRMARRISRQNSDSLKHLNYSLKQSINMFCSKCGVIPERTVEKRTGRCLKCETTLLYQCKKCKKTFEKMLPTFTHIRRLCESKDDSIVDRNNKVLKIIEENSELCYENGIITCTKCNKKFKTLGKFNLHKLNCGTKIYFPCKFCSNLLGSYNSIKRHICTQHEKEFEAEKFSEILQWSKFRAERKSSNEGKSINSHLPTKKRLFRSYFDLNKLIKMFCSKCNTTSERELGKTKIHCLKCDTALEFQCQMCRKTYDKVASLRVHIVWYCKARELNSNGNTIKLASNSIIEKKQSCNSHFNNLYISPVPKGSSALKIKFKYLYCNDCGYRAYTKHRLAHHIQFHHIEGRNKKGLIICPHCGRKFKYSRFCKAHQLVCNSTIHYKCTFCEYTAKRSHQVKRHITSKHADNIKGKNLDDILNEILKNRKNIKEKYEANSCKKLLVVNEDLSECFDFHKVIKMICKKCLVVSDRIKYQTDKYCSKCEILLEYQCQRCGQSFDKYHSARKHMKEYCRLIKKK